MPGHLGTTDVDIHVTIHADASQDLSIVEDALERAGFAPDPERAWRWLTTISGTRVQMEFVCDRDDLPAGAEITLPRCSTLRVANLRGTGFVARDNSPEEITGTIDGATVSRVARFAGAQGYVLAKACALRDRQAAKDCYDSPTSCSTTVPAARVSSERRCAPGRSPRTSRAYAQFSWLLQRCSRTPTATRP